MMNAKCEAYAAGMECNVIPRPDSAGMTHPRKQEEIFRFGVAAVQPPPPLPPGAPVMTDAVPSASVGSGHQFAPRRRRSALKVTSTSSQNAEPSPTASSSGSNRQTTTPASISAIARCSSVIVPKGMLFSRAELRPPPSASRRVCTNNTTTGFTFQSSSTLSTLSSLSSEINSSVVFVGCSDSTDRMHSSTRSLPAVPTSDAGSSSTASRHKRSESFAALRALEARRRAAWTFIDRIPSSSSSSSTLPPPSLAALGTPSSGTSSSDEQRPSSNRGAGSTTAKKTPPKMPPLPKMRSLPSRSDTKDDKQVPGRFSVQPLVGRAAAVAAAAAATASKSVVAAPLTEPRARGSSARSKESLEQKWAAWQQENRDPAPLLGNPAPAPTSLNRAPFASVGGGGSGGSSDHSGGGGGGGARKGWGGVGDFHEKVAILGEYVSSLFGRKKKAVSARQRCDDSRVDAEPHGVE